VKSLVAAEDSEREIVELRAGFDAVEQRPETPPR
jgi:hypothetical protein